MALSVPLEVCLNMIHLLLHLLLGSNNLIVFYKMPTNLFLGKFGGRGGGVGFVVTGDVC